MISDLPPKGKAAHRSGFFVARPGVEPGLSPVKPKCVASYTIGQCRRKCNK